MAVALTAAAGALAAIVAWRLLEEMTMKHTFIMRPTPEPRPHPQQAAAAEPELPREDDESTKTAAFDEECATPARPRPVPGRSGGGLKKRTGLMALALTLASGSLGAEALLSASVGPVFGGSRTDSKITYGGTLTLKGSSLFGFAVDYGYTPDFFGSGLGNNNLNTLMGNLVVMASPGRVRAYGSAGLGLVKARVEDAAGLFEIDSNELGLNVGGGLLFFPSDGKLGFHGDLRYFRNLTDPEPDDEFDIDLGSLDFWRGEVGITIRF
jgi:opacity protein-like surface antigen